MPSVRPIWVMSNPWIFTIPKSAIRTTPSTPRRRLLGLTSRWTIPCAWAKPSVAATCAPMSATWLTGSVMPLRVTLWRSAPGTYSMAR
ncbi:MAG: hypothetical protein U0166_13675 [Acidobacteriota bacterium]